METFWIISIGLLVIGILLNLKSFKPHLDGHGIGVGINLNSILSIIGIAIFIFFLVPRMFPNFWKNYYGDGWQIFFWGSLLVLALFFYLWWEKHKLIFAILFFVTLGFIINEFSPKDGSTSENGDVMQRAKITVFEIFRNEENKIIGTNLIYEGLTPHTVTSSYELDITPQTCGMTVNVWCDSWKHPIDLHRDCSNIWKSVTMPERWDRDIHITTVQNVQ